MRNIRTLHYQEDCIQLIFCSFCMQLTCWGRGCGMLVYFVATILSFCDWLLFSHNEYITLCVPSDFTYKGKTLAKQLARLGAKLILSARNEAELEQVKKQLMGMSFPPNLDVSISIFFLSTWLACLQVNMHQMKWRFYHLIWHLGKILSKRL